MRIFFGIFLFVFLSASGSARADDAAIANELTQKILFLESKISRLAVLQEQVLQKNTEINQELDTLKIWIRRHRN